MDSDELYMIKIYVLLFNDMASNLWTWLDALGALDNIKLNYLSPKDLTFIHNFALGQFFFPDVVNSFKQIERVEWTNCRKSVTMFRIVLNDYNVLYLIFHVIVHRFNDAFTRCSVVFKVLQELCMFNILIFNSNWQKLQQVGKLKYLRLAPSVYNILYMSTTYFLTKCIFNDFLL